MSRKPGSAKRRSALLALGIGLLMLATGSVAVTKGLARRAGPAPQPRLPRDIPLPAAALEAAPLSRLSNPPSPAAPDPPDPIAIYRGLGAWIDRYDYGHADSMDPSRVIHELSRRGVRTLYLGTGSWKVPRDMVNPAAASALVERAHAAGIRVVGWYLPGFADLNRDLRATLAILQHRTPSGQRFDGLAADIEDPEEIGYDLARFNSAVAQYSRRLRAMVPPGTILGAIVPDAKNIERAPGGWAGFPWRQIAADFDVALPMAYWSVTKPPHCPPYDAAAYIRKVVAKTHALMGRPEPIHPIGGLADCIRAGEVAGYVKAVRETGSIGGSLYDFLTTQSNREREAFWAELRKLN